MGRANGADAEALKRLLHQRGRTHLRTKPWGDHLLVFSEEHGEHEPRLRLTAMPAGRYCVSFRHHSGRWEPADITGTMAEVVDAAEAFAGWHLDPWPASGTNF